MAQPEHTNVPILDLSHINEPAARSAIGRELAMISRSTGQAALVNHSIPRAQIKHMVTLSRTLLDFPAEPQDKRPPGSGLVGYEPHLSPGSDGLWITGKAGALRKAPWALPSHLLPHLAQIEDFQKACQQLIHELLVCLELALVPAHGDNDFSSDDRNHGLAKLHDDSSSDNGSAVEFRIRRYRPDTTSEQNHPSSIWFPSSSTGSITLGFFSAGGMEIEAANGDWMTIPKIDGEDVVQVYLGDVVPFWSRGQLQKMRYRIVWPQEVLGTERVNMAYTSATTRGTRFKLSQD